MPRPKCPKKCGQQGRSGAPAKGVLPFVEPREELHEDREDANEGLLRTIVSSILLRHKRDRALQPKKEQEQESKERLDPTLDASVTGPPRSV